MKAEKEISSCRTIIQRHFGRRCQLREYKVLLRKTDYFVADLTLSNPSQRVVIKLAGPNAPISSSFDRTFAINQQVWKQSGIPTYEAIAFDMSHETVPYRYLLMSHVEGQLWSDIKKQVAPEEFRAIYRDFGWAVAQIHSISYNSFGEIGSKGEVIATETNYASALSRRATQRIRNPRHQEMFLSLLQQNKGLFNEINSPRLTHEDLNPGNILLTNHDGKWQLAAVVDFDSAWAGGFESDLARLELWRGMVGKDFFEEYQTINPIPVNYPQRRLLLQLLWCLEYADPSQRHYQDTKRICGKLGIAPIVFNDEF
ncbi:phosphotransferase [Planococcus shenhongbingii]|uniref:phosphotransferase family protein n=1 Tax=Planococcus shenhongbingii TaxID=3058398 RepID=UPI00262C83D8|nr:phosphotransferase [Planococcus sp. N016]WKA58557.1 phosphotransferase [Planococcus sp. N016]